MKRIIIHFQNHGQTHLHWVCDTEGVVQFTRPIPCSLYVGYRVLNYDSVAIGERILMLNTEGRRCWLIYPVERIEIREVLLMRTYHSDADGIYYIHVYELGTWRTHLECHSRQVYKQELDGMLKSGHYQLETTKTEGQL